MSKMMNLLHNAKVVKQVGENGHAWAFPHEAAPMMAENEKSHSGHKSGPSLVFQIGMVVMIGALVSANLLTLTQLNASKQLTKSMMADIKKQQSQMDNISKKIEEQSNASLAMLRSVDTSMETLNGKLQTIDEDISDNMIDQNILKQELEDLRMTDAFLIKRVEDLDHPVSNTVSTETTVETEQIN